MSRSWISALLLTLGILIVAVFVGAAVAPYVIDWNSYRDKIERELSDIVGLPVAVKGRIDVQFIPVPRLDMAEVSVGKEEGGQPFRTRRLTLELDPASFLSFRLEATHIRLEEPKVLLVRDAQGLALAGSSPDAGLNQALSRKISIQNLTINEGHLEIDDRLSARRYRFESVQGNGRLESLVGPYAFEGSGRWQEDRMNLRLDIGVLKNSKARTSLRLTSGSYPIVLNFRGDLDLAGEEGRDHPLLTGELSGKWFDLSGNPLKDANLEPAWEATAEARLSFETASLDRLDIQFGEAHYGAHLKGALTFEERETPNYRLTLGADHIRFDDDQSPLTPAVLLSSLKGMTAGRSMLPETWTGLIDLSLPSMEIGGEVIQNGHVTLTQEGSRWGLQSLQARLPGETNLSLSIDSFGSDTRPLTGKVDFATGDNRSVLAWFFGLDEDKTEALGRFIPITLTSRLSRWGETWTFGDLSLLVGHSQFSGALDYTLASGGVTLDLAGTSPDIDIDDFNHLKTQFQPVAELFAPFLPKRVSLSLGIDRVTYQAFTLRAVSLRGMAEADRLSVNHFQIDDFEGLSVEGSGDLSLHPDQPSGSLKARLKGESPDLIREFLVSYPDLRRVFDWEAQEGYQLSPLDISASLDVTRSFDQVAVASRLDGQLGATSLRFDARYLDQAASFQLDPFARGQVTLDYAFEEGETPGFLSALHRAHRHPNETSRSWRGSLNGELGGAFFTKQSFMLGGTLVLEGEINGLSWQNLLQGELPEARLSITVDDYDLSDLIPETWAATLSDDLGLRGERGLLLNGQSGFVFDPSGLRLNDMAFAFGSHDLTGGLNFEWAEGLTVSGEVATSRLSLPVLLGVMGQTPLRDEGGWSESPFDPLNSEDMTLDVAIRADTLDVLGALGGRSALLSLAYADGAIRLTVDSLSLYGGELKGQVVLNPPKSGGLGLSVSGELIGVRSEDVVWRWHERPVIEGEADASFFLSGQGISPAGLAASLNGNLRVTLQNGVIRGLSDQIVGDVLHDNGAAFIGNNDRLEAFVQQHLDAASLPFSSIVGDFSIDSGLLRSQTITLKGTTLDSRLSVLVDLAAGKVDSEITLLFSGEGTVSPPEIGLVFTGKLGEPERMIDVAPLAAYLNLRALEKNVDTLNKLEQQTRAPASPLLPLPEGSQ